MLKLLTLLLAGSAAAFQAPVGSKVTGNRIFDAAIPVIAAGVLAVSTPVQAKPP